MILVSGQNLFFVSKIKNWLLLKKKKIIWRSNVKQWRYIKFLFTEIVKDCCKTSNLIYFVLIFCFWFESRVKKVELRSRLPPSLSFGCLRHRDTVARNSNTQLHCVCRKKMIKKMSFEVMAPAIVDPFNLQLLSNL